MARIRSPGLAGNPLAVGLHSDPRCIGHHLAPATFLSRLSRGRQLPASTIVGGVVGPFAFTFMATWLFNHTSGSVLMTILLHASEGSVQAEGWVYTGLFVIVAIGLVIFDWKSWRSPAPASARSEEHTSELQSR